MMERIEEHSRTSRFDLRTPSLRRYLTLLVVAWTVVIAGAVVWHAHDHEVGLMAMAEIQARHSFEKDLVQRRWNALHGGVYVPVSETTPPNPYLEDVENRDVTTTSGMQLTLVNPAYMTRQVHELGEKEYGLRAHITSLEPLRPGNEPDPWEAEALRAFENGETEVSSVELIEGQEYLRLMRPLPTEVPCLKCHAQQGYEVGDIRGGISVSVPTAPLRSLARQRLILDSSALGMVWMVGLAVFMLGARNIARSNRRRDRIAAHLENSEALLTATGKVARVGGWEVDAETLEVTWTEQTYRIHEVPLDHRPDLDEAVSFFHPEDRPKLERAIQRALEHGEPYDMEIRFITAKGKRLWTHTICSPVVEHGKTVKLTGTFQDITERKQSEAALRRSETSAASMMRAAPIGIGVVVDRVLRHVNDRFCEMLGYSRDELVGNSARMLYPSDEEFERVGREKYAQIAEHGTGSVETRMQRKNGAVIDVLLSSAVQDPQDPGADVTFTVLDITGRKRAEAALKESEERYRLLFENSQAGLYRSTLDGRMLRCNQAFADFFGYSSPEQVLASGVHELYGDPLVRRRLIKELKRSGQVAGWNQPMQRRDGGRVWVVLSAHLAADEAGDRTIIEGSLIDVTERTKLQEQLAQAQKMEAVGLLAGGVAHDFNNILQTIVLHLQFVSDGLPPKHSLHADLESARAAADKAAALTRQLLAFGRRQVLQAEDLDLNEVVSGLLRMIRRVIGEHIDVELLPGRDLGTVHADPGQMEQVLMNLCVNARDAMPSGGRLTVETENVLVDREFVRSHPWAREGRYVLLSVTDSGCGMDQQTVSCAFDPFFTTKGADRGTGLGLASVFGIVKQHDGMVHIYSEVDKGTTLKIYLPIVEQHTAAVSRRVHGPVAGGSETLLLAEDDETVRLSVARVLEKAGYTVIAARDGSEAVDLFEVHGARIEMVILDVVMPVLSGADVYERIREIEPGVRVLFSSGYSANAIHTSFVLDEGKKLIQKPYDSITLLRKVRQVLDEEG